jgi:photosystem II stability/assembly factor-like uncharacterized protein
VYVFKTTDGGRHWRSTRAQGAGWQSDILSLTSDRRRAGTLYAGTDTAVYKTVDGGRNWRPFRQGLFPPPHKVCSNGQCWKYPYYGTPGKTNWNRDNGWVLDIAIDPNDRSVVYAAAGGVRKSTDGGHTWKSMLNQQSKWLSVTRIAIVPTRPESIYAITHNFRGSTAIYKSTNAGRTWQRTGGSDSGLPPSCCGDSMDALARDPANRQTLYAAVGQTVFVTTDGGAAWKPMANGLPGKAVTSLAADPRRPGTLYASVLIPHSNGDVETPTGGIYETTNGGQMWTEIWSGFGVYKVAIDPARPSTIYGAGWAGRDPTHANAFRLLRSIDGGHTWTVAGSSNPLIRSRGPESFPENTTRRRGIRALALPCETGRTSKCICVSLTTEAVSGAKRPHSRKAAEQLGDAQRERLAGASGPIAARSSLGRRPEERVLYHNSEHRTLCGPSVPPVPRSVPNRNVMGKVVRIIRPSS